MEHSKNANRIKARWTAGTVAKNDNHGTMLEQNGKKSVNLYYTPVGSCEVTRGEWGHGSHPHQKKQLHG